MNTVYYFVTYSGRTLYRGANYGKAVMTLPLSSEKDADGYHLTEVSVPSRGVIAFSELSDVRRTTGGGIEYPSGSRVTRHLSFKTLEEIVGLLSTKKK